MLKHWERLQATWQGRRCEQRQRLRLKNLRRVLDLQGLGCARLVCQCNARYHPAGLVRGGAKGSGWKRMAIACLWSMACCLPPSGWRPRCRAGPGWHERGGGQRHPHDPCPSSDETAAVFLETRLNRVTGKRPTGKGHFSNSVGTAYYLCMPARVEHSANLARRIVNDGVMAEPAQLQMCCKRFNQQRFATEQGPNFGGRRQHPNQGTANTVTIQTSAKFTERMVHCIHLVCRDRWLTCGARVPPPQSSAVESRRPHFC